MDIKPEISDLPSLARERVHIGPVADWVTSVPYNLDYDPQVRGAATWLLTEEQTQADIGATYVRTVVRLETMQSVQHHSQWRLEFEPQTQSILLHCIKIRRGSSEIEHSALERIQFLQREADLEGFKIDGWITLLLLLEDVRSDDVLECAYTVTTRPRLLANHFSRFFSLPGGAEVGKYHFSVRHTESRGLKWISSSPSLTPAVTAEGAELVWIWSGEKVATPEPEVCTSSWQLDFPWIQISDCPDWQTVARAFAEGWVETTGDGFEKFVEEIRAFSGDILAQVNRAIELIQDDFRYLSVNLKLGGQIPAPAETVLRRRYGDCKDLTFLLVQTLRALGISARPVLVDSFWQKSVASMLPSANMFNHVIVEYRIGDELRWVDATHKSQGGGALNRSISDFGVGLPIDRNATALATVPKASLPSGTYELRESFLLDTAGLTSFFAQVTTATGEYANNLRWEFANEGVETVAKKRLQTCANRFSWAGRVGSLQHRDNREANEFVIAEVFEVTGFLKEDRRSATCPFLIQSDITTGALLGPPLAPRRNPFAIPFPCHLTYTVEIDFAGFNPAAMRPFNAKNQFFNFTRRTKALPKFFKVTFSLETLTDAVPTNRLAEHRKLVESVWQESAIWIHLPAGYAKMRKRSDFGALPIPPRTVATAIPEPACELKAVIVPLSPTPPPENAPATVMELRPPASRTAIAIDGSVANVPSPTPVEKPSSVVGEQSSSPMPSPYRKRGRNRRCLLSLCFAIGAVFLFIGSYVAEKTIHIAMLTMLVLTLCVLALTGALVLAISGWRECAQPPRKPQRGRSAAAAALIIAGLLGLFLLPIIIFGIANAVKNMGDENRNYSAGEILKFDGMNFEFRSPKSPWSQVDPRTISRGTVLAYTRPGLLVFSLNLSSLEPGYPDALARVVEIAKADFRTAGQSCELISEGERVQNGITGWQIESHVVDGGQKFYFVHWVVATNGFGYLLTLWGPAELESQIKDEIDPMFSNFQPAARQP